MAIRHGIPVLRSMKVRVAPYLYKAFYARDPIHSLHMHGQPGSSIRAAQYRTSRSKRVGPQPHPARSSTELDGASSFSSSTWWLGITQFQYRRSRRRSIPVPEIA
eukprot:3941975-Rhodomonas_salina.3